MSFVYKDYRTGGANRTMVLDGVEFIRRYALHILPQGFMRIRHYGILAPCNRRKLAELQSSLGATPIAVKRHRLCAKESLELAGKAVRRCPVCGGTQWRTIYIRSPAA